MVVVDRFIQRIAINALNGSTVVDFQYHFTTYHAVEEENKYPLINLGLTWWVQLECIDMSFVPMVNDLGLRQVYYFTCFV